MSTKQIRFFNSSFTFQSTFFTRARMLIFPVFLLLFNLTAYSQFALNLKDINLGVGSGIGTSIDFSYSDGTTMYFVASTNGTSYELWKTNGTTAGTIQLSNIAATSKNVGQWNLVNGKYIFSMGNSATYGRELYITDGTIAGTSLLKDINIGTGSALNGLADFSYSDGTTMYFVASSNGTTYELWKTDGTTLGTIKLSNIGATSNTLGQWNLLNGKYIFSLNNSATVGRELYITDGTAAGTSILKDINLGTGSSLLGSGDFNYCDGSSMYFVATTNGNTFELWKTNGTLAGTIKLSNISSTANTVGQWNALNGKYIFSMLNAATVGRELYYTDGTAAGTSILKDINVGTGSSLLGSGDFNYCDGSTMYFVATTNGNTFELWKTNGTLAGTIKLSNISSTANTVGHWNALNGKYIFSMLNAATVGRELYYTDGTAAGTSILKDINVGTGSSLLGSGDFNYCDGSSMYFVATTNGNTFELWKTNGTLAGTIKLSNIGSTANTVGHWNALNGKYIFSMLNAATVGRELYYTDGTAAGTSILKDINLGTGSSLLGSADFNYSDGTTMYFVSTSNGTTFELWKTNGTNLGTTSISNIMASNNNLGQWQNVSGKYIFSLINSATIGRELWYFQSIPSTVFESKPDEQLVVFPNPFNESINIRTTSSFYPNDLKVYDILGEEILRLKLTEDYNSINLSSLKPGCYILKIADQKLKIIKQ
jgi:ELWxxDGT repeat protein